MAGVVILMLAGVGVMCGVLNLADMFGLVDLDDPELRFFGRNEDDG